MRPTRASLLGRKLQIWWQGKEAQWVMQGESSGWTSSALEPLPAVRVSSVCSIGAVAIEQFLAWGSAPGPCPSEATAPFRGSREINACPHRSSPITLLGGRGAALPDQLIPTHCGRSFPGTGKPALVCDQIPGITKPACYTLLPSRCIAVRTPSRITPLSHPPPLPLFSWWDLLC